MTAPTTTARPNAANERAPNRGTAWLDVMNCDRDTRVMLMEARYLAAAQCTDDERERMLRSMIDEELTVDEHEYQRLTSARLEAWVRLARTDTDAVRRVAVTYSAIFERKPGAEEFRRAMAVQAATQTEISDAGCELLLRLVPGIGRFMPPIRRISMQSMQT